jgi:hypothetical protein
VPVAPACFNYSDAADADLGKFSVIVAGRGSALGKAHYRERRLAGARIVQYIDIIDIGYVGGPFDERFCSGAPTLPGAPTNWGGLRIVDLSNAAWRDNLVEQMKWAPSHEDVTDLFLDVFGERLWTSGGWGAMSGPQQVAFKAGTADLANRFGAVRDQYRPDAHLWANGTWANGHPALKGVIEHHDGEPHGSGSFWWDYCTPSRWDTKGAAGAFVIASSLSGAQSWAGVPGVGPIAGQQDYGAAPSTALAYVAFPGRGGVIEPPPPPPPDLDPCRDLRATLAQTVSDLNAVRETLGIRTTERDEARASLAEAAADLAAIEDDLRKITGSAGSPAGNAADRLRGVKGRAMKAIERIKD